MHAVSEPQVFRYNTILDCPVRINAQEDNEATIKILANGKSPALRHLVKTHRVSLAWVSAVCEEDGVKLHYCKTADQIADGFTKALDRVKFQAAVKAIGMARSLLGLLFLLGITSCKCTYVLLGLMALSQEIKRSVLPLFGMPLVA